MNPAFYQLDTKFFCDIRNNFKESAIINKDNTKRGKTRYTANPKDHCDFFWVMCEEQTYKSDNHGNGE